jgi:membrane protease YdiL (CAAX protease family)
VLTLFVAVFWNAGERRLRCGWRLLGAAGILFALNLVFLLVPEAASPWVVSAVSLLVISGGVLLSAWLLDRRSLRQLGFQQPRKWALECALGLVCGAGLIALVFAVEWRLGWVKPLAQSAFDAQLFPTLGAAFLYTLFMQCVVGVQEELLFRGYALRNLAEGLRLGRIAPQWATCGAVAITSLFFGVVHLWNPNVTALTPLNVGLAGVLLGLGFAWTTRLAFPTGLHIAWNFCQGGVFGFPVSGLHDPAALITLEQRGPLLWTGGSFGPEGGLLCTAALLLGILLTYVLLTRLVQNRPRRAMRRLACYARGGRTRPLRQHPEPSV